ncbi:T9SS type A sorting domain-containing protein [Formosa sp. A9]|uniref:T9SS type A sorting domain-containing protein n=1 Tax=Formosa sp. A9 TaxID=3442641 RepID=UPI003EBC9012
MKSIYFLLVLYFLNVKYVSSQTPNVIAEVSSPYALRLNNNNLYVSDFFGGKILKIDISNPTSTATTIVSGLYYPSGIELIGNELFIAESDGKISKIDITAQSPSLVTIVSGLLSPEGLVLNGNDLYIAEPTEIVKIDITEDSPDVVSVVAGLNDAEGLALKGNDLYISDNGGSKIFKIDITEPNPILNTVIPYITFPTGLAISGNEMYIGQDANSISKIDITESSPSATPVLTNIFAAQGLAVKDNNLFIAEFLGNKVWGLNTTTLSVNDILFNGVVRLYPNPSCDYIYISNLNKEQGYTIINGLGQEILKNKISNNDKIDVSNLVNGLYLLKLENGIILRFIKE